MRPGWPGFRAIESRFYQELLDRTQLNDLGQHDRSRWPEMKKIFAEKFNTRTRDEWCKVFEGSDACFAPVLSFTEAQRDPHNLARKAFIEQSGIKQPAPAPRYSRTPGGVRRAPPERGEGGAQALLDWGFSPKDMEDLELRGLGTKE